MHSGARMAGRWQSEHSNDPVHNARELRPHQSQHATLRSAGASSQSGTLQILMIYFQELIAHAFDVSGRQSAGDDHAPGCRRGREARQVAGIAGADAIARLGRQDNRRVDWVRSAGGCLQQASLLAIRPGHRADLDGPQQSRQLRLAPAGVPPHTCAITIALVRSSNPFCWDYAP
jgi:hypothetical protein